jgi:hypothetical protein
LILKGIYTPETDEKTMKEILTTNRVDTTCKSSTSRTVAKTEY